MGQRKSGAMQRRVSDEPLPVRVDKACTLQGGVGFQTQRVRREGHLVQNLTVRARPCRAPSCCRAGTCT